MRLQARFGFVGLKDDAFPRVKLFRRGQATSKPLDFTGSLKSSKDMLAWTVQQTGVFVGVKVGRSTGKGCVGGLTWHARHPRRCMPGEAARRVPGSCARHAKPHSRLLPFPHHAAPLAPVVPLLPSPCAACMYVLQGQVKELDALARAFAAAGSSAGTRKQLLVDAQAAADAVDSSASPDTSAYVEYYIKTMQRVLDKGDAYLQQETKRLSKMAEDKAVAAAKRETFQWRLNILGSFVAQAAADGGKKAEL